MKEEARGFPGSTYVLRPSPSEMALDYGASDDGTYHGPADNGECIAHDGSSPLRWVPEIPQHTPGIGHGSRAEETGKESG